MRTWPVVSVDFSVLVGPLVFHHTCVLAKLCLPYPCARTIAERADLDAALPRDLFDGGQLFQSIQRSQHHVVRIGRAEALCENVGDAGAFHDGPHCTARNHTRARRGRLHQNPACSMLADDLVWNRPAGHWNTRHVAARAVDRFANSFGYFVCLARSESNLALTVTDRDEGVEGEATSALDDLGYAVDGNDVLDELASAFAPTISASAVASLSITRPALAALPSAATGAAS